MVTDKHARALCVKQTSAMVTNFPHNGCAAFIQSEEFMNLFLIPVTFNQSRFWSTGLGGLQVK